ncbi:TPA: restriction endonuclease subunit S [Streptococcus suis]
MSEVVQLIDLCKQELSGMYGIPAPAEEFDSSKVRYLRISDIDDNGNLLNSDMKSVSSHDINKYLLSEGDIVFARTGNSTGRAYYHQEKNGQLAFAGFLIKFSLDSRKVNPMYLKYYTISSEYRAWVKNLSNGSTRGNINAQTFASCPIKLPERAAQDSLVQIMSTIDQKIAINNQINEELEAMAKTLYDYWFVQFDFPDENGKPYKSSGGKMVYNDQLKREIPEGWGVETLSDLGTIVGGSTPSKANFDNFVNSGQGISWITPNDLSKNRSNKFISKGEVDVTEVGRLSANLKVFPKGTVLLSSRAPIGYLAIASNELTTNQGFKSFIPNKEYNENYIYYVLKQSMKVIEQNASGSTFKEISSTVLGEILVVKPKINFIKKFQEKIVNINNQIYVNEVQNQELTQLRDWLLPMLMNGQVRVEE